MGNRTVYLRPDAEAELKRSGLALSAVVRRGLGLEDVAEEKPAGVYPCCKHCVRHSYRVKGHDTPCRQCEPERSKT